MIINPGNSSKKVSAIYLYFRAASQNNRQHIKSRALGSLMHQLLSQVEFFTNSQ